MLAMTPPEPGNGARERAQEVARGILSAMNPINYDGRNYVDWVDTITDGLIWHAAESVREASLSRLDRCDPRVNVLRLLADGEISVGKACEALTEIAEGGAPILPQPIDPDRYDDGLTRAEQVAKAVRAEREACAKLVEDHGHSNGHIRGSHKHLAEVIRARDGRASG